MELSYNNTKKNRGGKKKEQEEKAFMSHKIYKSEVRAKLMHYLCWV